MLPDAGVSAIRPSSAPPVLTTIVGTSSTTPYAQSAGSIVFERSTEINRGAANGDCCPSAASTFCSRGTCSRESPHQVPIATVSS